VALAHLIPETFYFSTILDSWFAGPILAQDLPLNDPHERSAIILETIRGGRHKGYASIVFQFSNKVRFDRPVVTGDEMHFVLKNVTSGLSSFRKYKTFDSWVRLKPAGKDLAVGIGLPRDYPNARSFLMENPHRLVINLYEKAFEVPRKPRRTPPRLQVVSASNATSPIPSRSDSSIQINQIQFVDSKQQQEDAIAIQNTSKAGGTETPSVDRGPGKAGLTSAGLITGSGRGAGIGSAGGGVSSPSRRSRVRITPKISVKGEYDDNIFLYKNNKKGDFITTVSPGIIMSIDSGRNGLELEYTFGWVRYHDYSENDFVRHSGRLKFWQRLTRRLTFNLSDNYLKSDDLFDEDLAPDLRPQRIRHSRTPYQRNDFNASLDYHLGPESDLSVGYRHGFLDNKDPSLEDVTEHSPYVGLSYWVTKKDGFKLGYKYRRFDYTRGESYGLGNVDLDAHDADVVYMHRFSRRSTVYARYGFANRNFKGVPVSYHVHDGSVGFEYGFSPSTMVALDVGYFRPTGININGGISYTGRFEKRFKRGRAFVAARSGWDEGFMDIEPRAFTRYWGGDAGIEYEPVQDFRAYANVDYRKNDYALYQQDDDDTVGGRCGIRYRFLRWFYADLGYAHRRRVSDDPNNEYGDNRVTFTISASKPHPYIWEF